MSVVIAERELGYSNLGSTVSGRLSIETPQPDDRSWRCDYSITLPGNEMRRHVFGVDSYQALQLAMLSAVSELSYSNAFKSGHLTVFDEPIVTLADLKQCFALSRLLGDAE